jgi:hypothetical protein
LSLIRGLLFSLVRGLQFSFHRELVLACSSIHVHHIPSPYHQLTPMTTHVSTFSQPRRPPFVAAERRQEGKCHVLIISSGSVASIKVPLMVAELSKVGRVGARRCVKVVCQLSLTYSSLLPESKHRRPSRSNTFFFDILQTRRSVIIRTSSSSSSCGYIRPR